MTASAPPVASIVIASRESLLAMWQAEHVQARLRERYPGIAVSILGMTTEGDRILDVSLAKIGGKGLFVKELEQAMIESRADIAVHSMKDVPMWLPDGFALPAILEREDPRDAFVSNDYEKLSDLPAGSVVGTSSLRRESQLRARFPHLDVQPLRGNVQTRLRKLDEGHYAAIILAAAGLKRLGLGERIASFLTTDESLPAVGQGGSASSAAATTPACSRRWRRWAIRPPPVACWPNVPCRARSAAVVPSRSAASPRSSTARCSCAVSSPVRTADAW